MEKTLDQLLTATENELRKLTRQARRALRTGKMGSLTAEYVAITSGHGLSNLRCAKHMIGLELIEPRTPRD
jgi:hypothetical protein